MHVNYACTSACTLWVYICMHVHTCIMYIMHIKYVCVYTYLYACTMYITYKCTLCAADFFPRCWSRRYPLACLSHAHARPFDSACLSAAAATFSSVPAGQIVRPRRWRNISPGPGIQKWGHSHLTPFHGDEPKSLPPICPRRRSTFPNRSLCWIPFSWETKKVFVARPRCEIEPTDPSICYECVWVWGSHEYNICIVRCSKTHCRYSQFPSVASFFSLRPKHILLIIFAKIISCPFNQPCDNYSPRTIESGQASEKQSAPKPTQQQKFSQCERISDKNLALWP